jgi:hypothetical protein
VREAPLERRAPPSSDFVISILPTLKISDQDAALTRVGELRLVIHDLG